ncbi:integrase, catalytic region, zinc finger, CCHC-type containing protein [Tanacetum coccineum]
MQKNLALIAKYFKKIYKPTNNNLRTSLNSRNKNVDTTQRYKNDNQTGQFGNQRTMTVAGARESVGSQVVQQTGIQCFNCKEFGHFAKECRKLKRVKDSTYHKEKMLLCKQAEKGVPLQAEKSDWLADTDKEIDEQELEAHYSYMSKIQETSILRNLNPLVNTCLVEKDDSNVTLDSPDMYDNDIQTDQNAEDERVMLAYLIANLKLDVDEKSHNEGLNKEKTSVINEFEGESNSIRDSCLVALQNKQTEFERYKALNDRTVDYDKLERKLNETLGLLAQKDIDIKEGLKLKAYEISVVKEKHDELVKQSLLTKSHFEGLVKEKTKISYDQSDHANRLIPHREETLTLEKKSQSKLNKDLVRPYDYTKLNSLYEIFKPASQEYHEQLAHANEVRKKMWKKSFMKFKPNIFKNIGFLPVSKSISKSRQAYNVLLQECVSNDVMCSYLHSLSDLDAHSELQCLYLHKVKECECLAQKLSKQTESVSKEVYTELLRSFAKLEKHSISLELALQQCQEQMKNDTVCKEKASNVFLKEREQYFEIQDLKAQLQDKNIAISELKKLIEKCKGKSVETKFDKPSVVRQPNAQRIPKPSVLGKPTPFSDSLERKSFSKTKSVPKTNVSEGLSKPVTTQILPQTARQADPICQVFHRPIILLRIVQLILFIVDSGCTKHMTGNLKRLCNFVEKYLGTICFGNDQFAPILGYGDLVQGNITINRVYYVEGLNHNLFSVGEFYDADLEVAFWKSTCFVRDLQGNDLLTGNRRSDLYTISLQETTSSTLICFMAKASPTQACLWHQRLSHLNFDYTNLLSKKDIVTGLPKLKYVKDQLCSSYEVSKEKRSSFKTNVVPSSKGRLNLIHMDLCGPMRVESINGKKYILTLNAYFKEEGIEHQTSTPRTLEQKGIVERQNCTMVEAAQTMLSASKLPLLFWAEAIETACYTQNRSIIISTHEKTAYHIINDIKPYQTPSHLDAV